MRGAGKEDSCLRMMKGPIWLAPAAFVAGELFCLCRLDKTLLGLLTGNWYGDLGRAHGRLMQLHVWTASLMWALAFEQIVGGRIRREWPAAHRACGRLFLALWYLAVGPTSAYLSLTIQVPGLMGTLACAILLDVTLLAYYFFHVAWRVARVRERGAESLRLHGRLMVLGVLMTMVLLVQRGSAFGLLALRNAALFCLDAGYEGRGGGSGGSVGGSSGLMSGDSRVLWLADWLRATVTNENVFGVTMVVTGCGFLMLMDGPRSRLAWWHLSEQDAEEIAAPGGARLSMADRWRWRLRFAAYLVARSVAVAYSSK